MFLTRTALLKTILISSFFLLIGIVLFVIAFFIKKGDIDPAPTVTAGIIAACVSLLSAFIGIYGDGVSKPFAEGTRIVRKDLQPKKFIEMYKEKSEDGVCAVARPRFDMLELLYTAYDLTGDKHGRAFVIEEMKAKMKPSYKGKIAVYAADEAYREGNIKEGDRLLAYAEKHDNSSTVSAMADAIRKTSRAAAEGDTEAEEGYYNGLLSASGIFKADNAASLIAHWRLYQICKNTGRDKEAKEHLTYCAEHGGHTAVRKAAKALM